MPRRACRFAVAALIIAASALLAASPSEARYHRFKRINGHWIEGHFASQRHRAGVRYARRQSHHKSARHAEVRQASRAATVQEQRRHPETTASLSPALQTPARAPKPSSQDLLTALHRKAAERAAQLDDKAPPAGAGSEPVSVTLNFKTGLKATAFRNGDVSKEAFDPASLRAIAGSPPPRDRP